eukprot:15240970-Alexandrium_andersonii.AAC.1
MCRAALSLGKHKHALDAPVHNCRARPVHQNRCLASLGAHGVQCRPRERRRRFRGQASTCSAAAAARRRARA